MGPDVASICIDPRDKIIGHLKMGDRDRRDPRTRHRSQLYSEANSTETDGREEDQTGQIATPERKDCWDRQGITSCGNPPVCTQC